MSQGTPEQQVVALLQRGDLRSAHQLLLAMLAQRPDDAALRARAQQVEALIQQRLQSGLPVGPAAPAPAAYGGPGQAPPAAAYDPQTLAALQAQVLAEPVRYAYAYMQAGRLGESLQLLRIALAREPGNTQVRDLALYVARQLQQQQAHAQGAAPAPAYGGPPPAPAAPAPAYGGPPPVPAAPAPAYGGPPPVAPPAPQYAAPAPSFARPYAAQPTAPAPERPAPPVQKPASAPPVPPPRPSAPPASPKYPLDARVHRTGEMPAFMLDESPALAAAAAMPPRTQVPPASPPPAPRYPLDARVGESQEMLIDELVPPIRRSEPHRPSEPSPRAAPSAPPPLRSAPPAPGVSGPPPARSFPAGPRSEPAFGASVPSTPASHAPISSTSAPPEEARPEPNEVVRVAREMVRAAARLEVERRRPSTQAPPPADLAIAIDEPIEAVPVDFDEVPEPEEEAPRPLGQWPGPDWVDRSIPSATSPLARGLLSEPFERPAPSGATPAPLRSQPPAAHRWDADFSSPEQDAFQTDDEPMPEWSEPAPSVEAEDPLVVEARARAERMKAAFDRFSQRDSAPAPAALTPSLPIEPVSAPEPVDYSAGLESELLSPSDAATEIAVPSDLQSFEDEPLDLAEDHAGADEPYDFEPVPLEADAVQSLPPEPGLAVGEDEPVSFGGNPPSEPQFALADRASDFVSPPHAPPSGEVAMLEGLLAQVRTRRRSPSRYLERV